MFTWKLGLWVFAGHLIPFQQIKQNHFNHSDKRKYQTISYENAESKRKFLVPDRYTTEKLHIFCCLHKHKHAAYQPALKQQILSYDYEKHINQVI
jgi:ABC-type nickel/cobalt efflux system permease component RcnA